MTQALAPQAIVVSVGEELLEGRVLDTNAQLLAGELLRLGFVVQRFLTIGDAPAAFQDLLAEYAGRADAIVSSGGLGPTADDRVRAEAAAAAGVALVDVPDALPQLAELYRRQLHTEPPDHYLAQARVPAGALPLPNHAGTAWGFAQSLGPRTRLVCLPGPPREAAACFFDGGGRADLAARVSAGRRLAFGTFHTAGWTESAVEGRIRDLLERSGNPRMGIIASGRRVTVSVLACDEPGCSAIELLEATATQLRTRLGEILWGRDDETLEGVAVRILAERGQTVATAESCTGGRLAAALTAIPGASDVFRYGWITYADAAKTSELGVPAELLRGAGAVSPETAIAMAEGARRKASADWALSITGIAGPGGGSAEKPVGLVWIGVAGPQGSYAVRRRMFARAGRAAVQEQSVRDALEALRRELLGLNRLPDRG
ncbi:MAG: nicotinamide-nucleotide amidohydrolase family protein [Planctomycetota bacterium]|nr:MAG: nicotinamide-nucleotide amidohydrolase family protein [Planctomycetota bacterium]